MGFGGFVAGDRAPGLIERSSDFWGAAELSARDDENSDVGRHPIMETELAQFARVGLASGKLADVWVPGIGNHQQPSKLCTPIPPDARCPDAVFAWRSGTAAGCGLICCRGWRALAQEPERTHTPLTRDYSNKKSHLPTPSLTFKLSVIGLTITGR